MRFEIADDRLGCGESGSHDLGLLFIADQKDQIVLGMFLNQKHGNLAANVARDASYEDCGRRLEVDVCTRKILNWEKTGFGVVSIEG